MQTVEIHAAEADLARLVDAAEAGEEIVLARGGKPVAKIVAIGTGSVRLRSLTADPILQQYSDMVTLVP